MRKLGHHHSAIRRGKVLRAVVALVSIGVLVVLAYAGNFAGRTIYELLGENRELHEAITHLTDEEQIGYAKVLEQSTIDGRQMTRVLFVETAAGDPSTRILEREFEIEGDVVYFDAITIRFGKQMVMDGRARSIYLWRRVFGEKMNPEDGFAIESEGEAPERYRAISDRLSLRDREMFWSEIWALSNNPRGLADLGVEAIYGDPVYKALRPGLIYIFKASPTGGLVIETIPDL